MIASDAYVLPFRSDFGAPLGAVLECRGTSGWRYHDPRSGTDVIFYDGQANSAARNTGGMIGTLWRVAGIQPHATPYGQEFLVTLEPV